MVEVAIIMGSDSDYPTMREAGIALKELGVGFEFHIMSCHRTPKELFDFVESASSKGIRVFIAGAAYAAHLPGMIASFTELPVIGVPVPMGQLQGQDALLSIVQMPKGVPVATVAIGNAYNAGVLAAQILASGGKVQNDELKGRLNNFKNQMRKNVLAKSVPNDL